MPHVSGGECGVPRQCDACNLRIAHVHRTPGLLTLSSERRSLDRSGAVEIEPQGLVPGAGFEPTRPFRKLRILSPMRLPVSPPGQRHDDTCRA